METDTLPSAYGAIIYDCDMLLSAYSISIYLLQEFSLCQYMMSDFSCAEIKYQGTWRIEKVKKLYFSKMEKDQKEEKTTRKHCGVLIISSKLTESDTLFEPVNYQIPMEEGLLKNK